MREKLIRRIAWILPKSIVYWASIRMIAHATQGEYSNEIVPELGAMQALGRWNCKEHI
jgi:hypothetical protein